MNENRHGEGVGTVLSLGDQAVAADEEIAIEEGEPESLSELARLDQGLLPESPPSPPPQDPPAAVQRDMAPRVRADTARTRGRLMLRIPDDEVARPSDPNPGALPSSRGAEAQPAPPGAEERAPFPPQFEAWVGPPVSTSRIITINPPISTDELGLPPWEEASHGAPPPPNTLKELTSSDGEGGEAAREEKELVATGAAAVEAGTDLLAQGHAPDIVIDEGTSGPSPPFTPAFDPAATLPHDPGIPALDADEIGLKSDPPPRSSEPHELAEVSPEDVVSVESVPSRLLGKSQTPATPVHSPPPPPPRLVPVPVSSPLAPPPMNEAAAARRRARPWWEDLFNDDFIRTMAKITDAQIATEVNFIEESLGLAKNAVVLDLACGTGRHAIEMARRGYQIVGFDLSLAMLARAADEAQERDQKLNFVQGDMREMTFGETFDGVYAWNTSFGFFEEEKNNVVITNVHRSLKAGGLLLLDVINRDYLARQAPSLAWFEGDGCVCMDEMHVDWITSRMRIKRTMMLDDGRTKETDYSIRVYSLHELGKILHDQGFRVAEVSGRVSTPGVFFGADSPRILVVAEKR
jgi:SAM-dependent methyltransferase